MDRFDRYCIQETIRGLQDIPVWVLEVDGYNQPSGAVTKIVMPREQYESLKESGVFVYDKYTDAIWRAMA